MDRRHPAAARDFLPIADYALVGDCSSSALVGRDGSVDWTCLWEPHAPPIFGRLLDRSLGGSWRIAPTGEGTESTFCYFDRTAILETTHTSAAPLVGFLPPDDPRVRSNLERTRADLSADGLLHRNRGPEGSFTVCSLWLVSALVLDGRIDEAVELFELVLARASSPLGLLSEEVEDGTGALIRNFPQAFTHAAVISAAVNLARGAGIGDAPESHAAPAGAAHLVPLRER